MILKIFFSEGDKKTCIWYNVKETHIPESSLGNNDILS